MRRPSVLGGLLTLSVSDSGFWFGASPCPKGPLMRTSGCHGSMVLGRAYWTRPLHWGLLRPLGPILVVGLRAFVSAAIGRRSEGLFGAPAPALLRLKKCHGGSGQVRAD